VCMLLVGCCGQSSGPDSPLFFINRGILQGCPSSGWCWSLLSHLVVCMLACVIDLVGRGRVRACADDIGFVLKALRYLIVVAIIIEQVRLGTGLSLNMAKCTLVPLWDSRQTGAGSRGLVFLRRWLARNLPEWIDISVSKQVLYLGWMLGPGSEVDPWQGVWEKWKARLASIGRTDGSAMMRFHMFDSRVRSLVPYLSQFSLVPSRFRRDELRAAASLLKWPHGNVSRSALVWIEKWGGPKFVPILLINLATLITTSHSRFADWKTQLERLQELAALHLPVPEWYAGKLSPSWWHNRPTVELLGQAFDYFEN